MAAIISSAGLQVIANAELTESSGRYTPAVQFQSNLTVNSVASGGVNLVYAKQRTIASSGAPDTIDLNGVLFGPGGDAVNIVKLVGAVFKNENVSQILTIGAGSNPFTAWLGGTTPTIKLGKSGVFCNFNPIDGWTVTAGSADIITVTSDGGTDVLYSVFLFGRNA